jgi:tetratricopeptide (TPR) repeat protein
LHEFPFHNFSQARNEALGRAKASKLEYDYLLLTDADMEFKVEDASFSDKLTAAAYLVSQYSGITYWNIRMVRRNAVAHYKGVTHEFLNIEDGETHRLEGVAFIDHATGANRIDKYERDIRLLRSALETERDPMMVSRYRFYLANTLRDCGKREAALKEYLKRAKLGFWQEEVFVSHYNAANLMEALEYPDDAIIAAYALATDACPSRAEALHDAARFCRNKGLYKQGYEFAKRGLSIPYPSDGLFVSDWMYEYGLLDELSINAYWVGRYDECIRACDRLLNEGKMPSHYRERVLKNKEFALDRILLMVRTRRA